MASRLLQADGLDFSKGTVSQGCTLLQFIPSTTSLIPILLYIYCTYAFHL
jgi:hypothetical protein